MAAKCFKTLREKQPSKKQKKVINALKIKIRCLAKKVSYLQISVNEKSVKGKVFFFKKIYIFSILYSPLWSMKLS